MKRRRVSWIVLSTAILCACFLSPALGDISNIRVSNLSSSSATVTWITADDIDGCVNYGLTTGLGQASCDPRPDDDVHSVLITGLSPESTYFFEVVSGDETDDNGGAYYTFSTTEIGSGIPYVVFGYVQLPEEAGPAVETIISVWISSGRSLSHPLSTLTDSNGSWFVNLGNLKDSGDGSVFPYSAGDSIFIDAQGSGDGFGGDSTTVTGSSPQDVGTIVLEAPPVGVEPQPISTSGIILHQNLPNPIGNRTEIRFTLPKEGHIRLGIYDISGSRIRTLIDCREVPGKHSAVWDGRDDRGVAVASGIYFYRLQTQGEVLTRACSLLR
jgi:hypothetical protein